MSREVDLPQYQMTIQKALQYMMKMEEDTNFTT